MLLADSVEEGVDLPFQCSARNRNQFGREYLARYNPDQQLVRKQDILDDLDVLGNEFLSFIALGGFTPDLRHRRIDLSHEFQEQLRPVPLRIAPCAIRSALVVLKRDRRIVQDSPFIFERQACLRVGEVIVVLLDNFNRLSEFFAS